ncbi:MAG: J domain-containing protein [Bacteroidota bacterium]
MQYKDYYQVMGVSPTASEEEIRKVYKKLALKYHPDANPNNSAAEARFKEISEAKEVLLDSSNRIKYDHLRRQYMYKYHKHPQGTTAKPARTGSYEGEDSAWGAAFGNFWQEVFGAKKGPRRGRNYEANVKITLEEAYYGMQDVLKFEGRRLRIKVRPGIQDGQILRIKGQGATGKNGGEAGDLYLKIMIKPHSKYTRKGNDLHTEIRVPLLTAILGRKVEITTLKGNMAIEIPEGTQPGKQLKLKGLGMPDYDRSGVFGDLYLKIHIAIPTKLSGQERALYEQLEQMDRKK